MKTTSKQEIESWFKDIQDKICQELESLDGKAFFKEDLWKRQDGGGGRTRVIENGDLIEKGGVNFSAVHGPTPAKILQALGLEKSDFFATGVSIVIHPENPWVPVIHMNVRYFEMDNGIWWFGGGIDLTPHYVELASAKYFHSRLKEICDAYGEHLYAEFKQWADDYFFIPHRNETRGIGGIFFDRLGSTRTEKDKNEWWSFVKAVASAFTGIYTEIANKNRNSEFSESEKKWQYLRRGRYVEFNLVHDKGTKFGLDTNGRTESILMSMPPKASWEYNQNTGEESKEAYTLQQLRKGIDWINI